ncbi:substrate-binding domain-containing protein [Salegentibacter sp. LM13S]|uniref:LacI family DNA-binding transcriptional regulator n=1 Tax=Salegentibacter lacus TaxID=2873599 RepID=UPI001CCCE6D5|nr:substrate-binding domain-containing protein [Salegentibacter lacus]MBZ9630955.1 substrate-binding domain-containing protein [Salegentibacter lacus]
MKKKRYSLKDIANSLNVSATTVSFVLSGKGKEKGISDGLIQKITDFAKKIDYKPNQVARSLRTGKSKIIVCMVEDISNVFFAKIARLIEDIAYEKGYKVLFCSNENKDEKAKELISLFSDRQVDGYIITPTIGIRDTIKSLMDEEVPVVLFDRYFPDLETNYVVVNNQDSAYNATIHLINNQFKNIALVTTDVEQTSISQRIKGYKEAINEYGYNQCVLSVSYEEKSPENKKKIIRNFFLENPQLDAVLFATNHLTQAGLEVFKKDFPDRMKKLGILTFDDNVFFKIHTPSISAVSQPLKQMAEELMNIVLNSMKKPSRSIPLRQVVFLTELKIRDSSFVVD